jgi:TorA maturation chaperone TorD
MELFRALAVLAEPPRPETARFAHLLELGRAPDSTEYAQLFVFELYPYASVYLGADGMVGGEARDRIAGFWRALGQVPPYEPDHLSVLLSYYAQLSEWETLEPSGRRRAATHRARAAFLWEHLLSWLPIYLAKTAETAPPFYRRWGTLLQDALTAEARTVGPPQSLPLHLREARPLSARADLGRAGRELGIGLRAGERLFALEGMFGQAPLHLLRWLKAEAEVWGDRHEAMQPITGIVAEHWADRARTLARGVATLLPLEGTFVGRPD